MLGLWCVVLFPRIWFWRSRVIRFTCIASLCFGTVGGIGFGFAGIALPILLHMHEAWYVTLLMAVVPGILGLFSLWLVLQLVLPNSLFNTAFASLLPLGRLMRTLGVRTDRTGDFTLAQQQQRPAQPQHRQPGIECRHDSLSAGGSFQLGRNGGDSTLLFVSRR